MDSEREARLRREAMAWLTVRTQDGSRPISREEVGDFTFDGAPFRLIPPQQGIWKPAVLAAALTIVTNEGSPYADGVGPDGLPRYNWQGRDPQHADNRALRAAMQLQSPLIWLFGVGRAFYQPVYPVYLLREEPAEHRFVVVHEAFARSRRTPVRSRPSCGATSCVRPSGACTSRSSAPQCSGPMSSGARSARWAMPNCWMQRTLWPTAPRTVSLS